jgi:hypothetical protein
MQLRSTSLKPDGGREPYFDGVDTENANYRFTCAVCKAKMAIPFSLVHHGAWGWRNEFSEADVREIDGFFDLKPGRQVPPTPWSSISSLECSSCKTKHIFFATYDEYRNSVFRLVAQGLAYSAA